VLDQRLRHYCRNARCRARLKEPVENARAAFCCRTCYDNFYRAHCLVCGEPFTRNSSNQRLCTRRNCRREFKRDSSAFASPWGDPTRDRQANPKNTEISKGFWRDRSGRGFDWKAVGNQHHLIDRNGRVVVRLVPGDSDCWWIAQPRTTPELVYPDLDTAKRAAVNVALWALPWVLPSRAQFLRGFQAGKAAQSRRDGAGERYAVAAVATTVRVASTPEPLVGNDPGPIPEFLLRTLPGAKS